MHAGSAFSRILTGAAHLLRLPVVDAHPAGGAARPARNATLVPIRALGPRERERVRKHLLALSAHDRYLRFGYSASDEHIGRYVDGLDFERDELFGIQNRRLNLIGVAHLAYAADAQHAGCAEFGVSVSAHARGRGYGGRLFERAVVAARNANVGLLFIHALSENTAMLKIARKAGARVERSGAESEAYLKLPEPTLDSRVNEMAQDGLAEMDFRIKTRAKQFWAFLATLQEVRSGVSDARGRSAP